MIRKREIVVSPHRVPLSVAARKHNVNSSYLRSLCRAGAISAVRELHGSRTRWVVSLADVSAYFDARRGAALSLARIGEADAGLQGTDF